MTRQTLRHLVIAAAILVIVPDAPLHGQSDVPTENQDTERVDERDGFFTWKRGAVAMRGLVGYFDHAPAPQLDDLQSSGALLLGLTIYPDDAGLVGFDIEWTGIGRDYALDRGRFLIGDAAARTDLNTNTVMAGVRLQLPRSLAVRPYASAGFGYVHHKMKTDWTLVGIPVGTTGDQSSSEWRPMWGAGVEAVFGSWGLSFDYRTFSSTGSFGEPYSIGRLDLGGSTFFLGAAWYPGES